MNKYMRSFIGLAFLLITLIVVSPARGDFQLSVDAYQSPNFENTLGTFQFHVDGTSHLPDPIITISLTTSTPNLINLDYSGGSGFMSPPNNSDPTTVFNGEAISMIAINGVSMLVSDSYSYLTTTAFPPPSNNPTFLGGASIVFDLGSELVTVTPVASTGVREALFTLNSVPVPSSLSLMGAAGVFALSLAKLRRMAAPTCSSPGVEPQSGTAAGTPCDAPTAERSAKNLEFPRVTTKVSLP